MNGRDEITKGKTNVKKEQVVFSYRIQPDKYEKLGKIAEKEKRSINEQISVFLEFALEYYELLSPRKRALFSLSDRQKEILHEENDRGSNPQLPYPIRRYVIERDEHKCQYCGTTENLCVDHIIPRSKGGSNDFCNLVTACLSCNSKKGGRTPEQAGMKFIDED